MSRFCSRIFLYPQVIHHEVYKSHHSFIFINMFINEEALTIICELMQHVCPLDLLETLRIIKPEDNWVLKATILSLRPYCRVLQSLSPDQYRLCLMEIQRDNEAEFKLGRLLSREPFL